MSTSTDGILFYGFHWDEGEEPENLTNNLGEEVWQEKLAISKGASKPSREYPADGDESKPAESIKKEYKRWWAAKMEAVVESGCEVGIHCSYDYPMYYISVIEYRCEIGYPKGIESLSVPEGTDRRLREFCEITDIEYQEPKWWLVSLWG